MTADAVDAAGRIRCVRYRCNMAATACVARQVERWPASRQSRAATPRIPSGREFCAGGTCEQGRAVATALGASLEPVVVRGGAFRAQMPRAPAAKELEPPTPAADPIPPAQEEPMPPTLRCKFSDCGHPLRASNKSGLCNWHGAPMSRKTPRPEGWKRGGRGGPAPTPAPAPPAPRRSPAPAPSLAPAPDQPIEEVLRGRLEFHRARVADLAHHQAEVARLERALAALAEP